MIVFLDTSALLKRFVREAGREEVKAWCEKAEALHISVIAVVEMATAVTRKRRAGELSEADASRILEAWAEERRGMTIIPLTLDTDPLREAERLGRRHGHRAADLVHVGTALAEARAAGLAEYRFVSADRRQVAVAREEGLDVVLIGG